MDSFETKGAEDLPAKAEVWAGLRASDSTKQRDQNARYGEKTHHDAPANEWVAPIRRLCLDTCTQEPMLVIWGAPLHVLSQDAEVPMDIQKFIQEQGPNLVQQLTTKAGFAPDQAKSFLSQTTTKVVDLVKTGGIDFKSLAGNVDFSAISGKLGLGQIARQVGIDEAKATAGAKAVWPNILSALNQKGGIAQGASDLLKKAGGFFGQQP